MEINDLVQSFNEREKEKEQQMKIAESKRKR